MEEWKKLRYPPCNTVWLVRYSGCYIIQIYKANWVFSAVNFWAVISSFSDCTQFIPHFDKSSLKRGLCCQPGGVNGQSWNCPNHQVAQIWHTAGSRKHELNFHQSNIFVNQMLSMRKLLSTSHSDIDQILGVPMQICIFLHLFIVTTSIVQNVEHNKKWYTSQYSRISSSEENGKQPASSYFILIQFEKIHISVMIIKRWFNKNIPPFSHYHQIILLVLPRWWLLCPPILVSFKKS